ncbi:MAG: HesA/MoeB/ThiF family protein [Gammaproteobacteria bacterium]|nr:HesA/MoeB/ThiF family protein [Gammaproteobacteria bacterium]
MQPDYSRQIALREVGTEGQARLARSRVLVVGAGGLGSPVLQYLAGAGVGELGVVDHDRLDASNLHRQPMYGRADVGRPKAELAREAIARLNPAVRVLAHAARFDAGNARALVGAHDLVVDCSDNFRTKFLVNDAAVLERRPAVFASVYQYEGQIQTYAPDEGHACLRCLWPTATVDGLVGNCAEAGVLGPVPGALGAMQAIIALECLLGIGTGLRGELLLFDFATFEVSRLRAPRCGECRAPGCVRVVDPGSAACADADLEVEIASLEDAPAQGWEVLDIRGADEFAARPSSATHVPMAELLAGGRSLRVDRRYLLVCASGQRSLAAARQLRSAGYAVYSLSGGLARLSGSR